MEFYIRLIENLLSVVDVELALLRLSYLAALEIVVAIDH